VDIFERLLSYDAWTTRQYLALSESVADEPLDRPFDIGHGTLRQTWLHLIGNMETWTALMRGRALQRAVSRLRIMSNCDRRREVFAPSMTVKWRASVYTLDCIGRGGTATRM
jgi:hypothetical protein